MEFSYIDKFSKEQSASWWTDVSVGLYNASQDLSILKHIPVQFLLC